MHMSKPSLEKILDFRKTTSMLEKEPYVDSQMKVNSKRIHWFQHNLRNNEKRNFTPNADNC